MKLDDDWIKKGATQKVGRCLSAAGHQVYFVGGCVRNTLMGLPVTDIDMATDARPETVLQIFDTAGFRTIPTGLDHGTVTVVSEHIPHEITSLRRDISTDGRRATVAFSTRIEEDAARRDFTMNALYATLEGDLLDPVSGLNDLRTRRVRFIGTPRARITEDYLRILRFFRFHAIYGAPSEGLDADGLAACAAEAEGLSNLSRERIGAEMRKLLGAGDPAPAIAAMAQSGILARVLPGADITALGPLVHLEAGAAPDWRRRAAVLSAMPLTDPWRLSRREAADLATLQRAARDTTAPAELAYRHGAAMARDILRIRSALIGTAMPDLDPLLERAARAHFPVTAADLPGDLAGPEIGAALRRLEALWIASDFKLTREELLAR